MIYAGILTVKNHELTLKHRDSLLSSTVIMTLLANESDKVKKAAGRQHQDKVKIKVIPVDLLDSQKRAQSSSANYFAVRRTV